MATSAAAEHRPALDQAHQALRPPHCHPALLDLEANGPRSIAAPPLVQKPSTRSPRGGGEQGTYPAAVRACASCWRKTISSISGLCWRCWKNSAIAWVVVTNGAAALRAVKQEAFDLVLMDVQMPETNGLEATRAIRAWGARAGGHVPIVAMTAHAMKSAREECLQAGMDEYLSKPIQVSELLRVMEELTAADRRRDPTARRIVFDPRPLMRRISDDSELFHELIDLFQADCPRLLEQDPRGHRDGRRRIPGEDGSSAERIGEQLRRHGSSANRPTSGEPSDARATRAKPGTFIALWKRRYLISARRWRSGWRFIPSERTGRRTCALGFVRVTMGSACGSCYWRAAGMSCCGTVSQRVPAVACPRAGRPKYADAWP